MRIPAVKTVMTPFPYSIPSSATLTEARRFMRESKIRHLPVIDDHHLVGLLTDRDLKLVLGPEFDYPDPASTSVSEVLIDDPYVVDLETRLDIVLAEMARLRVGCALVTKGERLAGVFTMTDACRCFAEHLRRDFPGGGDTAA